MQNSPSAAFQKINEKTIHTVAKLTRSSTSKPAAKNVPKKAQSTVKQINRVSNNKINQLSELQHGSLTIKPLVQILSFPSAPVGPKVKQQPLKESQKSTNSTISPGGIRVCLTNPAKPLSLIIKTKGNSNPVPPAVKTAARLNNEHQDSAALPGPSHIRTFPTTQQDQELVFKLIQVNRSPY